MPRMLKKRSHKTGLAPGSVVYVGTGVTGEAGIEWIFSFLSADKKYWRR